MARIPRIVCVTADAFLIHIFMIAQDFIFKTPPYKKIEGDEYIELNRELTNSQLAVNGYNPVRNAETTYHLCSNAINVSRGNWPPSGLEPVDGNVRYLSFRCGRFSDILTVVVYRNVEEGFLFKVGTYPSLKDFHKDDFKKYNKVLSEAQKEELITAIVIANNGVGIGSYVYLRRVFEGIVFEEAEKAIKAGVISEDEFRKQRMDERIISIKDYLPAFLYDHHKELYGVLSSGIHELDEATCLSYFPVLYDCIVLILEDRLAQKEKEIATKKAAASLGKIAASIKK